MSSGPCLCSCSGTGRGHRCRSPVDDAEEDDVPGKGWSNRKTSYERFTETLDSALLRLQQTASPPRRTPQYTLFLRGCLEFEPVSTPGFLSQSSSGFSTPSDTTATSLSESQTPEEADPAFYHPRIADSLTLQEHASDTALEHNPDAVVTSIEDRKPEEMHSGLHDLFVRSAVLSTPSTASKSVTTTERIRSTSGSRQRKGSRSPRPSLQSCMSAPGASDRMSRVQKRQRRPIMDLHRRQSDYIVVAH